jgi:Raf kinase inhibitor-like YbhB/YbcL family protein
MQTLTALLMTILSGNLTVKSPAFADGSMIPARFTCAGNDINPEIDISDVPASAKSLVLIVDDPDAPKGTFDHWIMWNIPTAGKIAENSAPGKQGKNGMGENKYKGPCPPSGTHHYHFKAYALDTMLNIPESSGKAEVMKAIEGHVVAKGELIGLFKK